MMDPYQILGVQPNATDMEVKNAYRKMARQYHPDNYAGDPQKAAWAEERMKEINLAYDQIQELRNQKQNSSGAGSYFSQIRQMIQARRFGEADKALSAIPEAQRNAEWHYLRSIVLMNRGWVNDAMRELEMACQMDPSNMEYQQAKQMFNQTAAGYGNTYYGNANQGAPMRRGCDVCDVCNGLICADCCCECSGGDLIPCC